MLKRKICIITGSRSDYGIMSNLIRRIQKNKFFDLKLIVTGMHLLPKFGNTYKEIEKDKVKIYKKIRLPFKKDKALDISVATSVGIVKFSDVLLKIKPDIALVLGDRFESLAFSISALYLNIPLAHVHGGEITLAAIDDSIRHSISKMSQFHFVSHINYKKRLIKMGEDPKKIFVIGSLGVENIKKRKLFNRNEIEEKLKFKLRRNNYLFTLHPETVGEKNIHKNLRVFLNIIKKKFKDANIIITAPNIDMGNKKIFDEIKIFAKKNKNKVFIKKSLGQKMYFSILKFSNAVIGNSSSGIIEVPSFNIPTINIGERQSGRIKAESIIDCKNNIKDFTRALNKTKSSLFLKKIKRIRNPYLKKNSCKNLIKILKKINLKEGTKKKFYE